MRNYAGIICVVLLMILFYPPLPAHAQGHWEYWSETTARFKPDRQNEIRLDKTIRFHKGAMHYTHSDLHFRHRHNSTLRTGLGYRLVEYRSDDRWKTEHRPYGLAVLDVPVGSFDLENRHKMEYRMKPAEAGLWRYRNRLRVALPVRIGENYRIKPYVADEIFIYLNGQDSFEISRNRLSTGIEFPLGKNSGAEFYYLAQTQEIDLDEGEVWRNYNVIGIKLNFTF